MTLTKRIVNEAGELFLQKGVRNVTMNDLAEHLGMSKRTIYEQITDKDELLSLCIEQFGCKAFEEMEQECKYCTDVIELFKRMITSSITNMTNSVGRFFDEVKKYHPKVYQSVGEKYRQKRVKCTADFIEEGIKQGVFKPLQYPEFALIMVADLYTMIEKNEELDKRIDPESIKWVMVTFLRGMATLKGIERIDAEILG